MIPIWIIILIVVVILAGVLFLIGASLYRIVPADFADVVIQGKKKTVYSSHIELNKDGKSAYFHIPKWFFIFNLGMETHRIPLEILEIAVPDFLAFDKERARFVCNIVAFVTVNDPVIAAKRFSGDIDKLQEQVSKVVQATTRDATTKKLIREIINDREGIISQITKPLEHALINWGLDLNDIELVEFRDPKPTESDPKPSHVIADISSIIEEQINSEMRQKNADQKKEADLKEAIADEIAKKRQIERDEEVGKRKQQQEKMVFDQQKIAREAQLSVEKVQQVKTAEIEKEKQVVIANQLKEVAKIDAEQRKEVEAINKEQKELEGSGDRIMKEAQAKGEAASLRENGLAEAAAIEAKYLAEAKGKDELQKALNRFGSAAIMALVAEKLVDMQKEVGIAGANALSKAELRMFAGTDNGGGFDVGKMIAATATGNESSASAVLNRMARPNDLGFSSLKQLMETFGETDEKDNSKAPKKA